MSASSNRAARLAALALLTLAASTPASTARADGPALDCPSSSEEGQRLRDKNRYLEARAMFRTCSQSTCPSIVRKDCAKWLAELDETQPSVVIAAQDAAGTDLATVKVLVDDKQVAARIDGSSIPLDPGEHTLRVEAPGHTPLSQRLIVRVNEKNRLVRVVFQEGASGAKGASGPPKPPPTEPMTPSARSGPPVLGLVLTGVGVLALGSFAYFGLTSKSELQSLRSECAPFCDQSKLDDVKSRMLVADISLGVGIVAIGLAVVAFATHGSSSAPATTARR